MEAPSATHHSSNKSSSSIVEHSVLPSTPNHTGTSSISHESSTGSSALNREATKSSTEYQHSKISSSHREQNNNNYSSLKNEYSNSQPTHVPSLSEQSHNLEISSSRDQVSNDYSKLRDNSQNTSSTATNSAHVSSILNQASSSPSLQYQSNSSSIVNSTEAPHAFGEMSTSQHHSTPLSDHKREPSILSSMNISSIHRDQLIGHSSESSIQPIEANHFNNQSDISFSSLLHQSNLSQSTNFLENSSIQAQISSNNSILNESKESSTVNPIDTLVPNQGGGNHSLAEDHHNITSTMHPINPFSSILQSVDDESNRSTTANTTVNTSIRDHPISNSHSYFKEELKEASILNEKSNVSIQNQDASSDQITIAPDHHNTTTTINSIETNSHIPSQSSRNPLYVGHQSSIPLSTQNSMNNHIHDQSISTGSSKFSSNDESTTPSTVNPTTVSSTNYQDNSSLKDQHNIPSTINPSQTFYNSNQSSSSHSSVDGQSNLTSTGNISSISLIQYNSINNSDSLVNGALKSLSTVEPTTISSIQNQENRSDVDVHDQIDNGSSMREKTNLSFTSNSSEVSSIHTDQTSNSRPPSLNSQNQSSTAENLIDHSYIHGLTSSMASSLVEERYLTSTSNSNSVEFSSVKNQVNDSSRNSFSWDQPDHSSTTSPIYTSSTPNRISTSSLRNDPNSEFALNNLAISPNAASATDSTAKLASASDLVSNKNESSVLEAQLNFPSTPSVSGQNFTSPQLLDNLNMSSSTTGIDIVSSVSPQMSTSRSQPKQSFSSLNHIETSSVFNDLTNQPQLTSTIAVSIDSSISDHDEKTTPFTVSSFRNNSISDQFEMKVRSSSLPDHQNVLSTLNPTSIYSNPDQVISDTSSSRDTQTQLPTTDTSKISPIPEETSQLNLTTTVVYSTNSVSLPNQMSNTSQSDLSSTINPTNKNPSVASSSMGSSRSEWNIDENGQIKWSYECTYWGNEIQQKEGITEESCGRICLAIRKCTHFVWVEDDICMLKEFKKPVKETRIQGTIARCGFVVHRVGYNINSLIIV